MNWQSGEGTPPALLVLPPAAASLDEAHGAIEQWEHYSGKTLDPPQRLAVEIMMAESSSARWAARTTGREMPRQNGKGDEIEVVEFWGLTQRGEAILHTAHELNTVSSAHQRMVALLSHRDFRGRRLPRVLNGLGQQSIGLGDAVIQYRTRTAGGGRGLDDISRLVVDEAQHARPDQLASATPTLLANPNPQMNFAGTGGIAGVSDWWWSLRTRALGTSPGEFGYLGHSAERVYLNGSGEVVQDPVDPLDRTLWEAPNPALTYGRTEMEFLEEQLRLLGPALFAREHLGVWDPPPVGRGSIISPEDWAACLTTGSWANAGTAYALDVSPDGRSCAVAASDGRHVEIVKHGAGLSWVVDACVSKQDRFREMVLDPTGPAGQLISQLEAARVKVRAVKADERKAACAQFLSAIADRTLIHLGQLELDAAVGNADRVEMGDGGWLWSRKRSSVDISPLYAATLARWAASVHEGPSVYEERGMVSF